MDHKVLFGVLLGIGIVFALSVILTPSESAIPPTAAFDMIRTSNGTVQAMNYSTTVSFNGTGITITGSNTTKTIFFTSSANLREDLVIHIDTEKLLSTIGDSYADIYTSVNSHGHATLVDTKGMSKVRLIVIWEYGGADTGTQTCQIVDEANSLNVLITSGSLSTGINDSGDISIPVGLLDTVENYKIQCKSTIATDSPSLFAFRVYLKQ